MDIEKLLSDKSKRVGLVVAHYDDEVLFAGGILSKYAGNNWTLVSCFSPVKEDDERVGSCEDVVAMFDMNWIKLPFIRTKWNRREPIFTNFCVMLNTMNISDFMRHLIEVLESEYGNFDVIISHNSRGEYGNVQHALIHSILRFYKGVIRPKVHLLSFAMSKEDILEDPDYVLELDDDLFQKKCEAIYLYKGKTPTLMKCNIIKCKKEALWYELH